MTNNERTVSIVAIIAGMLTLTTCFGTLGYEAVEKARIAKCSVPAAPIPPAPILEVR